MTSQASAEPADRQKAPRPGPNRVQRFAVVGVLVTLVDLAVLVPLIRRWGFEAFTADLVSVSVATVVSLPLHRLVTLANSPTRRWFEDHAGSYLAGLAGSLAVDVVVFTAFTQALDVHSVHGLVISKAVALASAVLVRATAYRSVLGAVVRADQFVPGDPPPLPGDVPRLSVVIPAFEEEDRIAQTIAEVRSQLSGVAERGGVEVIVADDGSLDDTSRRAAEAGADRVVTLPENRGKGAAVKAGMLAASGSTRVFLDADLAYSPDQVLELLKRTEAGWDVVVGSRKHTATTTLVRAGRLRQLGSRAINVFTSLVLLGRYRDTQCGLKAFRAEAAEAIFPLTHIDRFALDIEVLYLVERQRLSLAEVPVQVANSERSTVRVFRDTARLLRDLVRIRLLARNGSYDATDTVSESASTVGSSAA
ncbi:MAG: glycosyltransferase [Microthrixaceae bacterium]